MSLQLDELSNFNVIQRKNREFIFHNFKLELRFGNQTDVIIG